MKSIFREYGKTIAAVCVALVLFLLITAMLILSASRQDPLEQGNFSQYQDGLFTRQLHTRKPPVITWLGGSGLSVGDSVELAGYFRAEDAEGTEIPVKILSVCDANGLQCENYFFAPGIYQVTVSATDCLGKTAKVLVDIPVGSAW